VRLAYWARQAKRPGPGRDVLIFLVISYCNDSETCSDQKSGRLPLGRRPHFL